MSSRKNPPKPPWWRKSGVREALDFIDAAKARMQAGDTEMAILGLEGAIDYLSGRKVGKKGATLFAPTAGTTPANPTRHRRTVTRHGGGPSRERQK